MRKSAKEYFRYLAVNPRDHVWGLSVTGAGYQPAGPGVDQLPKRRHPSGHFYVWDSGRVLSEYAVVYVTHGRGEYESRATGLVPLEPGDSFVLFPGVWHRYRPTKATGWGTYWVHFTGTTADKLTAAGTLSPKRPLVRIGPTSDIGGTFASILDLLRSESPGFAQVAAARLLEILARLANASTVERPVPRLQDVVRRARLALEEDPGGLPVVEDLIRQFDVSRTHFFRVFKQQTGQTPYQYHLALAIGRAGAMLRNSNLSIKQISLGLGFENQFHFSKLFKKKTGLSPKDYRGRWQEGRDASGG